MVALEQVTNRCGSAEVLGQKPVSVPAGGLPSENRGGVENPGGLFNTSDDPRVGGAVEKPGGLFNTSLSEGTPEATSEEEPAYIPRVFSPGPYSRGGRPKVLTPKVMEELCKLLSIGLSRRQAAAWLDIDHSTISHMAAKDEDFARSIARAEELASVQPRMVLAAAARKNWRAAAWMIQHTEKRPKARTAEEKQQALDECLADRRRNLAYQQQMTILEEEAQEAEEQRKRDKEEAWDRAMLAKERAERAERRKRKAERLQKEAEEAEEAK